MIALQHPGALVEAGRSVPERPGALTEASWNVQERPGAIVNARGELLGAPAGELIVILIDMN